MAINVYEYRRGGKRVYRLTHTYAWIQKMEMQEEAEDMDMSKAMSISRHRFIGVY